ncbi:hypothetical protein KR018_008980, partial [Drosophila ironensis]
VFQGKFYSTKYAPPKKESKESKQLSQNIQKFLKKREAEEAERKREERQKLAELLAKRDEKSKNKIRKMLKVTKSANKSVLEDAGDCNGPDVGDGQGDDYGYVSNEANALYEKYINKVRDVHEDKGFAPSRPQSLRDLSGTKERVKAAITKEQEEAKGHSRQRSSIATTSQGSASKAHRAHKEASVIRTYGSTKTLYDPQAEKKEEELKKRFEEEQRRAKLKRPAQPPPLDFQALLRLAEKKQHEPVVFIQPEKKKEPERLLSAKEKRELRHKEMRAQREERLADPKVGESSTKGLAPNRMESNGRIPKLSQGKSTAESNETKAKLAAIKQRGPPALANPSSSNPSTSRNAAFSSKPAGSYSANGTAKSVINPSSTGRTTAFGGKASGSKDGPSRNPYAGQKSGAVREFPPRDRLAGVSPTTKPLPKRNDQKLKGRMFPPAGIKEKKTLQQSNSRRIHEDDSEYDSELDDFIDDGDCEEDISSHIRDIFGYDKRRYRDMEDDDRHMESSFAQMQREEFISKKLGMQEDLQDMRMEAIHKKQKLAKKRARP